MRRLIPALMIAAALVLAGCRSSSRETARTETAAGPDVAASPPSATAPAATATPAPDPEPTVEPAPTPEPEPPPPPPPVAVPVRLRIPRIGVDARIIPVGVNARGEMDSPNDAWSVGWYAPGFKPWELGNAVLAAHVDYVNIGPAVFYNLKLLTAGDRLMVLAADSQEYEFEVKEVHHYAASDAPVDRIFGENPNRGLNLVTCGGTFNPRTHDYDQRVVVYTEAVIPAPPEPPPPPGPPPRLPRILWPDAG